MAPVGYFEVSLAVLWFLSLWYLRRYKILAGNWPVFGMLPTLLFNVGRVHEICTKVLRRTKTGTFVFKGPWFLDMEILATANPANVHYIMSANFQNYPKGPKFKEIFDVFGDGIFNADADSWKNQRKITHALINHKRFHRFLAKTLHEKVENSLVPVLETVCNNCQEIDLQDLFQRLAFDATCTMVTGYDPGCLSVEFPDVPFSKAMDDAEEAIFLRHVLPEILWKFQRKLGFGAEAKLRKAREILDQTIEKYISMKRDELKSRKDENSDADLLTSFIITQKDDAIIANCADDKFLRDTVLNLMIAGRDTTSSALTWFFWLLTTHPQVERKITEELRSVILLEEPEKRRVFKVEELGKLVYMHAALCEALRLYPPVPFQHKEPLQPNILPTGHYVHPKMKVVLSMYAMGRMESIWGKNCLEFKPERWISEHGTINHEPSYKFMAFNAGPRTCLGKEVAFTEMKAVAATMIHNYRFEVVEGHKIAPNCSIILYMGQGFKVRIKKKLS